MCARKDAPGKLQEWRRSYLVGPLLPTRCTIAEAIIPASAAKGVPPLAPRAEGYSAQLLAKSGLHYQGGLPAALAGWARYRLGAWGASGTLEAPQARGA